VLQKLTLKNVGDAAFALQNAPTTLFLSFLKLKKRSSPALTMKKALLFAKNVRTAVSAA
jgi:hypothetical protein